MNAHETEKPAAQANNSLPMLRVPQSIRLPDSDGWENRFEIHSETSNRIYVIAQNRKRRHWGCSCPSYRTRRRCKHLEEIGLPTNEVPYEALIRS